MLKKRKTNAIDYPVMALEGLWWVEDGIFDITVKDNWFYTLMIMQPDVVTQEIFEEAREEVRKKKGDSDMLNKAAARPLRRRSVRADHAHRSVCHRTCHHRPHEGIYAGEWIEG